MKRILGWVAVFILVVGGAIVTFWPVATWRLYDANWQPLALTQAESYCVGQVLVKNAYANKQGDSEVDDCVKASTLDTVPDVARALHWGCEGIRSLDPAWTQADCLDALDRYEFWFLLHGGWTWGWNDQNPRPNVAYINIREAPRGSRNDSNRTTDGRFG